LCLQAAFAWALAMHACMMGREDWPKAALKEPFEEVFDQGGRLIFRGPR